MAIVFVEVESIHGAPPAQRMIFWRAQDHTGARHKYGPVLTTDPAFDAEAYASTVAVKVEEVLANAELESLIRSE